MNLKSQSRGFTLIEMIAVLGSFGVLAVLATTTLLIALGNMAKTRATQEVRRNGENALQVMERHLRVAKALSTTTCGGAGGAAGSSVEFTDQSGNPAKFSCSPSGGINVIASSSGELLTDPSRVAVTNCNIFTCDAPADSKTPRRWVRIQFTLGSARTSDRPTEKAQTTWNSQVNIRFE